MAAEQVFETSELLEMILLYLPLKDILMAKAITKRWKQLIDTFVSLQKATYIIASGDAIRPVPLEQDISPIRLSKMVPLLETTKYDVIPLFDPTRRNLDNDTMRRSATTRLHWVSEGPLSEPEREIHGFRFRVDVNGSIRLSKACYGMFFTQPPVTALVVSALSISNCALPKAIVYNRDGITMSDIQYVLASEYTGSECPPKDETSVYAAFFMDTAK